MSWYNNVYWFQAAEPMGMGDYIIEGEDLDEVRIARYNEIPIGMVIRCSYQVEMKAGDRVPVRLLFFDGRLLEYMKIGDHVFVKGQLKTEIKKILGIYKTRIVKCRKCGGKGEYEEEI